MITPYASGRGWTLYHAPCEVVLPCLEPGSVDALVTDPPYSSGGFTRGDRNADPRTKYATSSSAIASRTPTFSGDNRDQRSFLLWSMFWLEAARAACREGASIAVFSDWRQLPTTTDALQIGGWVWRGIGQWEKVNARPQMGRPRQSAEYLVWGSNGPMPIEGAGSPLPGYVVALSVPERDRLHLTQKPDEVMRWAVGICPPGGLVLDPFAGSGSTGVAALATGRRFVGVERDPAYAEIAARRLRAAEATGEQLTISATPAWTIPALVGGIQEALF